MNWQSWLKLAGVAAAAGIGAPQAATLIPLDGVKPEHIQAAASAGVAIVALVMQFRKTDEASKPQEPPKS